ncbi:hypothetical protein ID866_11483, partial [Astraeus odoratus]
TSAAATTTTSSQQQTPAAQTASSSSTSATQTSAASSGTSTSVTSSATSAQPTSTLFVVTTVAASQYTTTTSGEVVVTVYTTSSVTHTATSTQSSSGSMLFWSNTGAVAGMFSVRAIKFNKEIAAAAVEAAKSTRSPFDDFSESGGGDYGYSDNGHSAYGKSLFPAESYGMSEVVQYDPYVASAAVAVERPRSRKGSEVGAPGIAGVGAGNLAREPSRRAPYHAFTGPNSQDPQVPAANLHHPRSTATQDILEAAGLAGTGAAAMANNRGRAFINRRPSEYTQNTHRSGPSQGHGSSSDAGHPAQLQPAYPPQRSNSHAITGMTDPCGGYIPAPYPASSPSPSMPNPHDLSSQSPPPTDDGHVSAENEDHYHESNSPIVPSSENCANFQDDGDYSGSPRVLRVTNMRSLQVG